MENTVEILVRFGYLLVCRNRIDKFLFSISFVIAQATMYNERRQLIIMLLVLCAALTVICACDDDTDIYQSIPAKYHERDRRRSKRRRRDDTTIVTRHLSDCEFRRSFRISRKAFDKLI